MVNHHHHHTMIGSWCLWLIIKSMPMHSDSVLMRGCTWLWCPWLCGPHYGHVWMCSFTSSFTQCHQWLLVMCASVCSTHKSPPNTQLCSWSTIRPPLHIANHQQHNAFLHATHTSPSRFFHNCLSFISTSSSSSSFL